MVGKSVARGLNVEILIEKSIMRNMGTENVMESVFQAQINAAMVPQ